MNAKGIKFLAVLAVLAMAFATLAVIVPSSESDATGIEATTVDVTEMVKDPKQISSTIYSDETDFFITDDVTVKIKDRATGTLNFYVQNGKQLQLDFTTANTGMTINIYSVSGDQTAKLSIDESAVSFASTAGEKMSAYYTSAVVTVSTTVTGSTFSQTVTKVKTNALFSADKVFTAAPTIGSYVDIANGQMVATNAVISGYVNYGVLIHDEDATDGTYKYYGKGDNVGNVTMEDGITVSVISGSANIKYTNDNGTSGIKVASVTGDSAAPVAISIADDVLAISGSQTGGELTLTGTVNADGLSVAKDASAIIASKAIVTGTVAVEGTLTLKSKELTSALVVTSEEGGLIVAQAKELWTTDEDGDVSGIIVNTEGFKGFVDTTAISTVAKVQDYFATATVPINQTFDVITNTTLYGPMGVEGILVIEPGVTLTIMADSVTNSHPNLVMNGKYSQIINYGKIVVKTVLNEATGAETTTAAVIPAIAVGGGQFINEGTIEMSSKASQYSYALVVGATMKANTATYDDTTEKFSYAYNGVDTLVETNFKFVNNGTMMVGANDAVFLDKIENNGTIRILGSLFGYATYDEDNPTYNIDNFGKAEINGKVFGTFAVDLKAADAEFNVQSAQFVYAENSAIRVANTGIKSTSYEPGSSTVVITKVDNVTTAPTTYTVKGLKMVGANDSDTYKSPAISMSGLSVTSNPRTETKFVNITTAGLILVPGELTVPAYVNFAAGTMKISGTMTISKDADCAITTMTVTGTVIDNSGAADIGTANAAYYEKNSVTTYTTFMNAVSGAISADINTVTVGGSSVVIDSDFTVPEEMTITGQAIKIGKTSTAVVVNVPANSLLSIDKITLVNGELYAYDATAVTGDVAADVVVAGETDILYRSLGYAISKASPGDTIALDQNYKASSTTLTIPAGITVDATISDNAPVFAAVASDLVIEGTLIINDFLFIAETDDNIGIEVDGYLKDADDIGGHIADKWFTPVGVSYVETLIVSDEEITYFVITSLDNLQQAVIASDDGEVTVEGDAKLGNVTIVGTEDKPAVVYFKEDISAGTISLDNAKIVTYLGNKVNATFSDALGSIVISGAYVATTEMSVYSEGLGVSMTGGIIDAVDESYSITFIGITGMDGAQIWWGNYDASETVPVYPVISFTGTTVAENKNQILNPLDPDADPAETNITYGTVSITGSLTVDNSSRLEIVADLDILGSLIAMERTSSATAGQISVEGDAFVGMTQASIYDKNAALKAYEDADIPATGEDRSYGDCLIADGAVMSGSIEFANGAFITVADGSTVDEAIVGDMKSLPLMIDGVLWITVYGNTLFSMDGLKAPIFDCMVDEIVDDEGNVIAEFSHKYGVIYNHQAVALDTYEGVYINVEYDVFSVVIKTDGSIKAVYIDGILTTTGYDRNVFELDDIVAGRHVVTVEPVTGYSADKCYLYLDDGTKLTGMTFIFDQDDCKTDDQGNMYVTYNVAGTEIIPEPEPVEPEKESEWTITTILLVVLVILIAIMAVIVALRLNRN